MLLLVQRESEIANVYKFVCVCVYMCVIDCDECHQCFTFKNKSTEYDSNVVHTIPSASSE